MTAGKLARFAATLALLAALLLAWELAVRFGYLKPYQFPPVSRIARGFVELSTVGFPTGISIWSHTLITVARVLQGYAAALILAVPLGLLIGALPVLDNSPRRSSCSAGRSRRSACCRSSSSGSAPAN